MRCDGKEGARTARQPRVTPVPTTRTPLLSPSLALISIPAPHELNSRWRQHAVLRVDRVGERRLRIQRTRTQHSRSRTSTSALPH